MKIDALEAANLAASLPIGKYRIEVYNESIIYNHINTASGTVLFSEEVALKCGCCTGYDTDEANINELSMRVQLHILIDMYERYVVKK